MLDRIVAQDTSYISQTRLFITMAGWPQRKVKGGKHRQDGLDRWWKSSKKIRQSVIHSGGHKARACCVLLHIHCHDCSDTNFTRFTSSQHDPSLASERRLPSYLAIKRPVVNHSPQNNHSSPLNLWFTPSWTTYGPPVEVALDGPPGLAPRGLGSAASVGRVALGRLRGCAVGTAGVAWSVRGWRANWWIDELMGYLENNFENCLDTELWLRVDDGHWWSHNYQWIMKGWWLIHNAW